MEMVNPISLTRGEYWLLEAVVEEAVPVRFLFSKSASEIFNKPSHGLDLNSLAGALRKLHADR